MSTHRRTVDTAATADKASQHQVNVTATQSAKRMFISGITQALEEELVQRYGDGRMFTFQDVLLVARERWPDLALSHIDARDIMNKAIKTDGRFYRTGGLRSGAYAVHTDESRRQPPPEPSATQIIDEIITLLSKLSVRINKVEAIQAKLTAMGLRIEP